MIKKLKAMSFTLQLDREANQEILHVICPGGYCLNGKAFDFTNVGFTPIGDNKLRCEATRFDEEFLKEAAEDAGRYPSPITAADVKNGTFSEFFVFNGYSENDADYTDVLSVSDLEFEFEDGNVLKPANDSPIARSANENLALEIMKDRERDF